MPAPLLSFARYREIAIALAARLDAGSGEEVIVASGGVASAVTAELLRRAASGAVTVRLLTIDNFARRIVNDAGEYPRVADEAERRLAMRAAADKIDDPILQSRGVASMLERSYRDVRDGGIGLDVFESRARGAGALRNRERTRLILRVWREHERLIAQLGAIDPADLLSRAASLIQNSAPIASQIVAGFYDMTGAQLRVVTALAAAGRLASLWMPIDGEDEAYRFAHRLIAQLQSSSLIPHPSSLRIKVPEWTIAQYETKSTEMREVCRSVRELLDRDTPPSSIGIVARSLDPYDVSLIQRFAAEFGFRLSREPETPLIAHRVGRAICTILRLRDEGFPRGDVIEVLRDGFQPTRRVSIDNLDRETRDAQIAGGVAAGFSPPTGGLKAAATLPEYWGVVAELETLSPAGPLAGRHWSDLLQRVVGRIRLENEFDLAAAGAIDDVAALFRRSNSWNRVFDIESVCDALQQESLGDPRPATRDPRIWLGDIMQSRGRNFEHLFAIRMQEDVLPQRRVDDPLLPDSDRRLLAVREIGDGRDEERLLFQLLIDAASTSVRFSFAGSDGFGKVLRASPLLKQFAIGQRPDRRATLLQNFSASFSTPAHPYSRLPAPRARQMQLVVRAGTQSVFDGYLGVEFRQQILQALQSVSPTQLEDFGECPQKFLLKHLLGVRDIDDPERELQINHREKGTLDHRILERFYRSLDPAAIGRAEPFLPQLAPALRERIDVTIDEAFAELEAAHPPFNRAMRDIERRATKRNLQAFLAADIADLVENNLRPERFEYKFGTKYVKKGNADHPDPFVIEAHGIPIRVDGSVDRIDVWRRPPPAADAPEGGRVHTDARLRIVDYKSGKALRHRDLGDKIDRGVRLQLALYAMAVAKFFDIDPRSIDGAVKPLMAPPSDAPKFAFDLGEKEQRLRQTLDLFVGGMLRGAFPAFPNDRDEDFNSCKYCPVNHSCRTKHDDTERYAVTRLNDPRTLLERLP
jgi:ATP-dependent helicase/DNAse subunit B